MRLVWASVIAAAVTVVVAACGSASPSSTAGGVATPAPSPSTSDASGRPAQPSSPPLATASAPGTPAGRLTLPDGTTIPLVLDVPSQERAALRPATKSELLRGERSLATDADSAVVKLAPGELLLMWVGTVCERGYTVELAAPEIAVITPATRPGCDLGRVAFAAVLSLPRSIETASFRIELRRPQLTG